MNCLGKNLTYNLDKIFCVCIILLMKERQTEFTPKSLPWNSKEVLNGLTRSDFTTSEQEVADLHELFWNDLCSEYDAENICNYMERGNFNFTSEFKAFEKVWRRDEYNHYLGFRQIYSLLYKVPEEEIKVRLEQRQPDFDPIRSFLEDEFVTCLVFAYDEIATTKAYSTDHEIYKSFGDTRLYEWIRKVTRDESFHFTNCMEVIKRRHPHRIPETPRYIQKFIEWDLGGHEYKGTFVLDHEGYYFTPAFLNNCGRIIINYFNRESLK